MNVQGESSYLRNAMPSHLMRVLQLHMPRVFRACYKLDELPFLYNRLCKIGLIDGKYNINWLICCRSSGTCKLGLCSSQDLPRAIANELDKSGIICQPCRMCQYGMECDCSIGKESARNSWD